MSTGAVHLEVVAVDLFERPTRLRLPFRFGVVTLRETPQAFVRVRVCFSDGRTGTGQAAELMVPKWFDKSAALSNDDNVEQLRASLRIARNALTTVGRGTAFGLHAAVEPLIHAEAARRGLPGLVASFGLALLDRAMIDAIARAEATDVATLVRANRLGISDATTPDLAGFDLDGFLAGLAPRRTIRARHTVGLIDPLTTAEIPPAERLADGLPQSLEEIIAHYGLTSFKLKVQGKPDEDIAHLAAIAAILDRSPHPYEATLDGNEQFADAEAVAAFWARLAATPALARLASSILFVEQPIHRGEALKHPVTALARAIPVEIDESDAAPGSFVEAKALGYTGISSKSCKGFYRALLNRARVARWSVEAPGKTWFMSAEDLTTQAGIAVQQDLALAAIIGMDHIERNGHHYVDGFGLAGDAEQARFLAEHPDLYARSDGRVRLAIRAGTLDLTTTLQAHALGTAVSPDWESLTPMSG